jgi:hypothetical protein
MRALELLGTKALPMIDHGNTGSARPRTPVFDASGRTYTLTDEVPSSSRVDELAEAIEPFIVNIWASVLELPLVRTEPRDFGSDALTLRVTVPLLGHRWIRVASGPELGRIIGAHVFDQPIRDVDFASSRMAVLELASSIARHAAVIEHPAWPWSARGEAPTSPSERTTACELWFACHEHPVAVALLCPAVARPSV